MPEAPVTVCGGLPLIADVWFSGPDYFGEYDSEVTALYWMKRNGERGKQVSERFMESLEKRNPYWQGDVTEQVSDYYASQEHAEREGRDL